MLFLQNFQVKLCMHFCFPCTFLIQFPRKIIRSSDVRFRISSQKGNFFNILAWFYYRTDNLALQGLNLHKDNTP
jgi:hypothetical protein